MMRGWFAMVILLALATSIAAQDALSPRGDDTPSQAKAAQQPSVAPQGTAVPAGYMIEVKIVQGDRLLEKEELPRAAILPEFVPMPTALEEPIDPSVGAPAAPRSSELAATRLSDVDGDFWDIYVDQPGMKVLAAPRLVVSANRPAFLQLHATKSFSHLVPTSKNTFRLEKTPPQELGLKFECTVKSVEGDVNSVELSPIRFSQTTFDGREIIEEVDLDVGKPIFSTRSLETTAKVTLGKTRVVPISAIREQQVILLLKVRRAAK